MRSTSTLFWARYHLHPQRGRGRDGGGDRREGHPYGKVGQMQVWGVSGEGAQTHSGDETHLFRSLEMVYVCECT